MEHFFYMIQECSFSNPASADNFVFNSCCPELNVTSNNMFSYNAGRLGEVRRIGKRYVLCMNDIEPQVVCARYNRYLKGNGSIESSDQNCEERTSLPI